MRQLHLTALAITTLLCIGLLRSSERGTERSMGEPESAPEFSEEAEGTRMLGRQPNCFVPNLGQWDHKGKYVARFKTMTLFLENNGWTFTLISQPDAKAKYGTHGVSGADKAPIARQLPIRGVAVRMAFKGAGAAELSPQLRAPGVHHYFLGDDRDKWRSDVPLYGAIRYREVQTGVDILARENHGDFEYDLILKPSAQLDDVEITVEGTEGLLLDADGALIIETILGPVRMPAPTSWEEAPSGERIPIVCRYVLLGDNAFGFEVPSRQAGWALVVDPGMVWSTYLGHWGGDLANAVAVDAQGAVTVAGQTGSTGFPTTTGAFNTTLNGLVDAFVTRLSQDGSSLIYSTFLGGSHHFDEVFALALDAQGATTVVGMTASADFPTTASAFDTSHNGGLDGFVARLSPSGKSLHYATYLGGTQDDRAFAVDLDAQGAAIVTGMAGSPNFPTTPQAFSPSFNGSFADAFVTRLTPSGSGLVYSTFLGGAGKDQARAIAVDAQGTATVTGETDSNNFPTTVGAFDTSFGGSLDVFVTRLAPSGSSLLYSTYLGDRGQDIAYALAIDLQGSATLTGVTTGPSFPTTPGAFNQTPIGRRDVFVTRLSSSGSSLVYSTFLGGTDGDYVRSLALGPQGEVTIAGSTKSINFPTTPLAFDTSYNTGLADGFVSRLSATGSHLVYSTYLGGTGTQGGGFDGIYALALDAQGAATVVGWTKSRDFPTTVGSLSQTSSGGDGFVTRLDMLPTGVTAYGNSSPGCNGPLEITATSLPRVGNLSFSLECSKAPPSAIGGLLIGGARFSVPQIAIGIELLVDPNGPFFITGSLRSNQAGLAATALPIPQDPALQGFQMFTQFVWAGPNTGRTCPPLGFSASSGLHIRIL